jgi:hypothetical protein
VLLLRVEVILKRADRLKSTMADRLLSLAIQEYDARDCEKALGHTMYSLKMFRKLRNYEGTCTSLGLIGYAEVGRNNYDAARTSFEERLRIARSHSNERDVANSLVCLSILWLFIRALPGRRSTYRYR